MQNIVPFEVVEIEEGSYHPIVRGYINGFQVNLILDTGASRTVIDNTLAENLPKVEVESAEPYAAGINAQRLMVEQVKLPSLILGAIDFGSMNVFKTDLSPISELYSNYVSFSIHGLLGCDFLVRYSALVNFHENCLVLNVS
ncbi:MAG TPA: retropepsin-like aspartic protease [Tenuifilaceae bacterium]|nr:retropepsin-like aspartic protease [Tenuifilaceae bacterium]HPE17870.1 retropepsin-like aspartic protease [Tenuifilaceae bacterium]HPJ45346.1 retropepsin-like aspartic protease [Tenuifilaceae bacterium]HPQ33587.1 retropepsin-like aspartic protease [Tenuifilaceae bacterium]HRX67399.1 retropepsin-like aspartic protease [Tenuifilaceae bacterium]